MQYSLAKGLVPISFITKVPDVLWVNANLSYKFIGEIVTFVKKNLNTFIDSSSGIGNPLHLNGKLLDGLAGTAITYVPDKGATSQIMDVTVGNVAMALVNRRVVEKKVMVG